MKSEPPNILLSVLLADDDTDDRLFFDKALREIPIATRLTTISDGEQLMNYLNANIENLPDVLFLDLSMPRKTGFECLAEIRENPKLKNLPVVVFTISFPHNKDFELNIKNMLSKLGSNDYINKTTDFSQLKHVIQEALIKATEKKILTLKN